MLRVRCLVRKLAGWVSVAGPFEGEAGGVRSGGGRSDWSCVDVLLMRCEGDGMGLMYCEGVGVVGRAAGCEAFIRVARGVTQKVSFSRTNG